MTTIGILIPCYNEEDNVSPMVDALSSIFTKQLSQYDYNIVFIDNCSTDKTVAEIERVCRNSGRVKAILNARNFVWSSSWHGIINTPGDCVICIPADFQVPPESIVDLVAEWEKGCEVVCLIKNASDESSAWWHVRQLFYKVSEKYSDGETLPNFTGGLYSRSFINLCNSIDDPLMYFSLRSFICSHGFNVGKVYYSQKRRKSGKSKNTLRSLFRISLLRFTESSTLPPYMSFMTGLLMMLVSLIAAIICIVINLAVIQDGPISNSVLLCSIFFVGGLPLVFLGILGEYLIKINGRLKRYPIVIEKGRLNFEETLQSEDVLRE